MSFLRFSEYQKVFMHFVDDKLIRVSKRTHGVIFRLAIPNDDIVELKRSFSVDCVCSVLVEWIEHRTFPDIHHVQDKVSPCSKRCTDLARRLRKRVEKVVVSGQIANIATVARVRSGLLAVG